MLAITSHPQNEPSWFRANTEGRTQDNWLEARDVAATPYSHSVQALRLELKSGCYAHPVLSIALHPQKRQKPQSFRQVLNLQPFAYKAIAPPIELRKQNHQNHLREQTVGVEPTLGAYQAPMLPITSRLHRGIEITGLDICNPNPVGSKPKQMTGVEPARRNYENLMLPVTSHLQNLFTLLPYYDVLRSSSTYGERSTFSQRTPLMSLPFSR